MASFSSPISYFFLTLLFIIFSSFLSVHSFEFEVGDDQGWMVPSSKNGQLYNQWASKHRFQVDDTVHFKYKKDSVLVVNETEYDKCHSVHPVFFSNNGNTAYKLDRAGLFYFISGLTGHCERGQKMIIKVLEPQNVPPPSSNENGTSDSSGSSGKAVKAIGITAASMIVSQFVFSFLVL